MALDVEQLTLKTSVPVSNLPVSNLPVSNVLESVLADVPDGDVTEGDVAASDVAGYAVEAIALDNGLTLIYQYLPTPIVVVDAWLGAGAAVEPPEWAGAAHFLEHMVFRGTERIQPGAFDRIIENSGGLTNAATGHDYVHYYITATAQQLPAMLPAFADLLLNAAIPEDEFERERQVVLEEIRQAQDEPDWVGLQVLAAQIYGDHPYGRPILGTEAHLLAQSPLTLRQFHQTHYRPEQMTLVVVGGLERDRALALVQEHFQPQPRSKAKSKAKSKGTSKRRSKGDSSRLDSPATPYPPVEWPTPSRPQRQVLTLPNLEQTRLLLAWVGPGLDEPRVGTGLDLLAAILTEGRLSRLVWSLREERGWVMDIDGDYSSDRHSGLLGLTAWLEPQYLDSVEAFIHEQIQRLHQELISEVELQRAKRLLCNDFAFSLETPGQRADLYGYYATLGNLELAFAYPDWVKQWTPETLQALAIQYLSRETCATTILQPED